MLKGRAANGKAVAFAKDIQGFACDACQAHHRLSKKIWRAKRANNKARALRRRLQSLCKSPLLYPRAEAFRQRLLGPEQKHFFTCFRRRGVPPTNNQAERSLRPLVIMRKIVHGKGRQRHSHSGPARSAHDEHEASRLLQLGMKQLGLAAADLVKLRKNPPQKVALAWWLRRQTTVPLSFRALCLSRQIFSPPLNRGRGILSSLLGLHGRDPGSTVRYRHILVKRMD